MNILVTGANGFIGRALIRDLSQSSHHIFGLDVGPQAPSGLPAVKGFFVQNLTQPFKIDIFFDVVIHLGALNVTHVGKTAYDEYHRVNVDGTKHLLKGVQTKHFVFISTAKVYKNQGGEIDERSLLAPQGAYERSKLEAEQLCGAYLKDESLTIFRPVNVVGPGQAEKAVVPVFFQKAIHHEPLEIIYSPQTLMQMLYVGDLIRAFRIVIEGDKGCGILNLSSDEIITLGELAREVINTCHSSSKIRYNKIDKPVSLKVSARKAFETLNWRAQTTIKEMLQIYYEFIRD